MTVLVAYASKHGSTAEVAEGITDALVDRHVAVELLAATDVRDVARYDAVIVGSAVYYGRWLAAAHGLLVQHRQELLAKPVWVFSVGRIPQRPEIDIAAPQVVWLLATSGAREHQSFAGRLTPAGLDWRERSAVRVVRAPYGDYLDWPQIVAWAEGIADELVASR